MNARHLLSMVALALGLGAAGSATAAPVVLYGPELDPVTAAEKAEKELRSREFTVVGSLAEAIGGGPDQPVVFGADVRRCEEPLPDGKPVGGVVVMAREDLLNMSYMDGMLRMQRAVDALPCHADQATTDNLYDLFFLQGVAHYLEGLPGPAKEALSQATAIDPARPWNEQWPPGPKPTFLEALQEMLEADPTALRVEIDGLTVDGRPMEQGAGNTIRPRRHLLQVGEQTFWVEAGESRSGVVVTTAQKLAAGLLVGDESYGSWLAEKAEAEGWQDVVVLSEGGMVVYRRGAIVQSTVLAPGQKRPPPKPGVVAGLALVGVGSGTAAAGLVLHGNSWATGLPGEGALMPREDYEALVEQNRIGLGLTIAGAAVAAAGVAVTIAGAQAERPQASTAVQAAAPATLVAPWAFGAPEGFVFGFTVVGR